MTLYDALYGCKCRTPLCWTKLGERKVLSLELVQEFERRIKFIQERLKATFDRQKSYANLKRKDMEYSVDDQVFLKVFPWRKVLRSSRKVAYQLNLLPDLDQIHDVFHISMLRCYRSDPSHIVPIKEIKVRPDLSFEEEHVKILERDVKVLRRKRIPLVNILWLNHRVEEATWEAKDKFRQQYPHLFKPSKF
ncbi:DNA/RNA polymerases superfamily protein [Gossypium australe]|uniref:DNA/RNA polymerases superfamily protein n=1 Tax=Gossypium australe TaxID=47621 RepID=A0A5B6VJZ6_9ROSI|nr:DNA/RNA polymerases superfamily protein [Gossypium australe]